MSDENKIALLRGINVGGHRKIPMADLRSLCNDFGWENTQTYIQSGNVAFTHPASCEKLEGQLETAIADSFGFSIAVIVRTAAQWSACVKSNPFRDVIESRPHLLMLALAKHEPKSDMVETLQAKADSGERVARVGRTLWVDFCASAGKSNLTPSVLDRAAGSPVTLRNWRTATKLTELISTHLKV